MTHAVEGVQLLDFGLLHRAVAVGNGHLLAVLQLAAVHAAYGDTAGIARIVQARDEHLGGALYLLRSGDDLHDLVQQVGDVARRRVIVLAHPAVLGRAVDHRKVQLVLGGVEREHQVEHHLVHFLRPAVGLVHLVDHHYGLQTYLKSLLQHEARLRHRPLEGVDQQQTTVSHVEHALHFAAEVAVSRRVDDVDFCSFPVDAHILRQNGDASLALQVVGVQHLARQVLSLTEQVSGQHHLVHERSLAVVYMRYNRNVPDVLHISFPLFSAAKVHIFPELSTMLPADFSILRQQTVKRHPHKLVADAR